MKDFKQVNIPIDYFLRMAIKEYTNWGKALVREFIQNSVDAGAKQIKVHLNGDYLVFEDDGQGMSQDIIEGSLLTLGGSFKNNKDAVGGLGKAKEILYFSWPEWNIHSRDNLVHGKGGSYKIEKTIKRVGTRSIIRTNGKVTYILDKLVDFCKNCSLPSIEIQFSSDNSEKKFINRNQAQKGKYSYTIDGLVGFCENCSFPSIEIKSSSDKLEKKLIDINQARKGKCIYNIDGLGSLYEREDTYPSGLVIIQTRGLYMFNIYTVLDKSYIFNIATKSYDCLTANRDGFIGDWNDKVQKMISTLSVESESLNVTKEYVIEVQLLTREKEIEGYETIRKQFSESLETFFNKNLNDVTEEDIDKFINGRSVQLEKFCAKSTDKVVKRLVTIKHNTWYMDKCIQMYKQGFPEGFIIITDREPNNKIMRRFTTHKTYKTAMLWKMAIRKVANCLHKEDKVFGYGLVDIPDKEAEVKDGYFLVNPSVFESLTWKEMAIRMLFTACHEWAHFMGHSYHNESFILSSEKIMLKVFKNRVNIRDLTRENKSTKRPTKQVHTRI